MTGHKRQWQLHVDKAREDTAPLIDISEQVAQRIACESTQCTSIWPTWPAAIFTSAAALLMLFATTMSGASLHDPLGDWFSSFFLMM